MVKADLHNHLRTSSRVLSGDFNRAVNSASNKLGEDAIIGVINRSDRRYEKVVSQKGYYREFVEQDGSAVYVPSKRVYIVKGQEVRSRDGRLLVLGIPIGVHLSEGRSLEDTIKEAKEDGGIIIASSMLHKEGTWEYLTKNLPLLERMDGIEVYNGQAELSCPLSPYECDANETSREFYEFVRGEYPKLGALSSSDGDSFYEIGSSYTELGSPDRGNFNGWLKSSINETSLDSERGNTPSVLGAIDHILDTFIIRRVGSKIGLL